MIKKVMLCVGHCVNTAGQTTSADGTAKGGVNEFQYNKKLIDYVAAWLSYAGVEVDVCVAPDKLLKDLNAEVNYFCGAANAKPYDLVVQLHLNAFDGSAEGTEVWYVTQKETAERVAAKLGEVWKNRGAKYSNGLYWLKKTNPPAILIESFFCDSKKDYDKAVKLGYEKHGRLIAEGIVGHAIEAPKPAAVKYTVQIGTYNTEADAKAAADKLKKAGFTGAAVVKK